MHSTLRKELCGTPKILSSVRARSTNRSISRTRKFSTRTYLLNQSGPKNGGANCSGADPRSSDTPGESPAGQNAPARGIGAELEKWIQAHSERDQSQHIWDTVSEKDENGRRRLLPHVKRDLEKLASGWSQDGNTSKTVGLEIRDGRIRPLTASEVKHDHLIESKSSDTAKKIVIQTSHESETPAAASDVSIASESTQTCHNEKDVKTQGTSHKSQQEASSDPDGTSPNLDGNLISRFHGSSAARRQRERQPRIRDKEQAVQLPGWFSKRNVFIWGEGSPHVKQQKEAQSVQTEDTSTQETLAASRPHNDMDPEIAPTATGLEQFISEDKPTTEKQQTSGDPSDISPPSNASEHSEVPHDDSPPHPGGMSGLKALPNSGKKYYIHDAQRKELIATVRGRLRLPEHTSTPNKLGGIRSHVLVHYTAQDGDLFLDRLVDDVVGNLRCNLIRLDAQDISSLISNSDIDPMMADEAKFLSYDIYEGFYKEEIPGQNDKASFNDDVDDADIDEDGPPGFQGMPFAIGKPITIDLKAIFGERDRSRRNNRMVTPRNMVTDFMGRPSMSKPMPHVFQSLVDSILSSPGNKQKTLDVNLIQKLKDESWLDERSSRYVPPDATIVHVKDLKAIQDTNIGKHFLSQLYEQVDRRRSNGEGIMLIGTSCEREEPRYNSSRVRNMQISEPDEISSTIVITPAWPRIVDETDSEVGMRNELQRLIIPHGDKITRLSKINARHLYEMLQSKEITLDRLPEGFWKRNFTKDLHPEDQLHLQETFWTFSYVQRLAAVIAGLDMSKDPRPISRAAKYIEDSDKIKFEWADSPLPERHQWRKKKTEAPDSKVPEMDKIAHVRSTATKHEKKLLAGVVEPGNITTTFKDIHIPPETVEALETLTTLSLVRPDAFRYGVLASDRIPGLLLYGPPGTGKTLAAKAVARESGATILEVSAADINDMYVGEGEKNVKALFSLARKLEPCVVFLDEADSMFSARADAGRRVSHRETINQFLREWDGMSNDAGSAFLMVATNRPFDLDDAVLRRLPRRLLIDLPTEKDRLEILKIHLRNEQVSDEVDLAKLAARTPFYSGSDLKNVAVAAALSCVREENELAKQHTGSEPFVYPEKRMLRPAHFEKALEEIGASISEDMASLRAMKKFDDQYGDKKNRKRRSPKWGFKTAAEADAVLDTVKVRS